ncbi:MAG: hypothetical protein ACRD2I_16770 [Vicinamibacterales bacterium]
MNFDRLTDDLLRKLESNSGNRDRTHALVKETLRQVWNARGAADIAKLEVELLARQTVQPEGPLTQALRTLDRQPTAV